MEGRRPRDLNTNTDVLVPVLLRARQDRDRLGA